jgi:hypothetical protein
VAVVGLAAMIATDSDDQATDLVVTDDRYPTSMPQVTTQPTTIAPATTADEIQLTWDGADCVHEGTTELAAGPITLTFVNASDQYAFVYMAGKAGDDDQFLDGVEAQELMDHLFAQVAAPALTGGGDPLVDQRSAASAPTWAIEVPGSTHVSEPGETFVWEGELEPAHYHTFCGRARPHLDYRGFTLTVTG